MKASGDLFTMQVQAITDEMTWIGARDTCMSKKDKLNKYMYEH